MRTGNLLDILILFGSLQGFITGAFLFAKKKNVSSHLLAFILLIISAACLNIYLFQVLPQDVPTIIAILENVVPLIIVMPLGPLIYLHVKTFTNSPLSFKSEIIHFIPVLLDILPSIFFLGTTIFYAFDMISSFEPLWLQEWIWDYEKYIDIPRWLSTSIYLIVALRLASKKRLLQNEWIKQFLWVFAAFQLVWLIHLIPYLLSSTSNWLLANLGWYPIYIPLTILVYWLGINGLLHLSNHRIISIDEIQMKKTMDRLNQIMQNERLYLNSTFSLNKLVEKTGIPQKEISGALNQYQGKSFNEWVNEYRISEVKRKLADQSYSHLSITGVALESGFNSQATFQRAFKNIMKITPKEYRLSLQDRANTSHS